MPNQEQDTVKPYNQQDGKKEQVREMFDTIAPKYDLLNHLLSMNIDKGWRRKMMRMIRRDQPRQILDVATGTGDMAMLMARKMPSAAVTGADLSPQMLAVARRKVEAKGLDIRLEVADAEQLPFADNSFDAVTAVFGVRNFENVLAGLTEMQRVTDKGGRVYVMEFSMPRRSFFAWVYKFYFRRVLPAIGRMVSKDPRAYTYLPESVESFPHGENFLSLLKQAGFEGVAQRRLTFGVATIYTGKKE